MTPAPSSPTPQADPRWLSWLLAIGLPLCMLLWSGQDANWDLWNYHLYNAHAWLHGRYALDIAPAGMQSWHNPLLDVPVAWLTDLGAPGVLVDLWLTLPIMLGLWLLLRLPIWLSAPIGAGAQVALALLAASGAGVSSALGATFNDSFVGAGILAAIALALTARGRASRWLLAGVLAGATAGLKLTATGYCLALVVLAIPLGDARSLPKRWMALALGGLLGALLTYGFWGFSLWSAFGNPVFPYFNQWFRSPATWPLPYADERFNPKTLLDALLVPWRLLFANALYSELRLRDPRLLLGFISLLALPFAARRHPALKQAAWALLFFYVAAFAFWCWQSGIYRYLVVLEWLAVLGLVLLIARVPSRAWRAVLLLALTPLVVGWTLRPDWGHQPFRTPWQPRFMPALPADSLVLLVGIGAQGYQASALPDAVPALGLDNSIITPAHCTGLRVAVGERIRAHHGPLWSLGPRPEDAPDRWLRYGRRYGIFADGTCRPVVTPHETLFLCPLRQDPMRSRCRIAARPGP